MRVENELDRLVGNPFERGSNFRRERRELIVDDYDAVGAGRYADVAARSLKHVDRSGDLADLDFNFAEILLLREERSAEEKKERHNRSSHGGEL